MAKNRRQGKIPLSELANSITPGAEKKDVASEEPLNLGNCITCKEKIKKGVYGYINGKGVCSAACQRNYPKKPLQPPPGVTVHVGIPPEFATNK